MNTNVTRREFIGNSGKAAFGLTAAAGLTGCALQASAQAAGAKREFNIALVGCGGMGRYKLGNFMTSKKCNVAAVCDVDPANAQEAVKMVQAQLNNVPKIVKNFHAVMEMKDIDIVIVATPDHWHAAPMLLACQAGKDVYCEKPCCHNIKEGHAMVAAARKYNRVVQVGTHQRSIPHIQAAREFVRGGKLGLISMTNTFTYGNDTPNGLGNDPDTDPPAGVDYDLWLGPAPVRPFNKRRFHNTWRWYFDYGCGMVGDWNVHLQDIIMWSMGVTAPISVSTSGGHLLLKDDRDTPDLMQAVYEFAAPDPKENPNAPAGFVHTYTMRKTSGKPWDAGGYGMDFHGTNGMLHLTRGDWNTEPDKWDWRTGTKGENGSEWRLDWTKEQKNRNFPGADQLAHQAHVENFLQCVRERKSPIASIELHYNSVVACHLANVSLRVGRKIFWDHEKVLCFKDKDLKIEDPEANALLGREYRKGYELPQV